MTTTFYVVDRLEEKVAVLVSDDGASLDVDRSTLPARLREGSVLRVQVESGRPDWSTAKIDSVEHERRLKQAQERLDQMKRGDPGGDISL